MDPSPQDPLLAAAAELGVNPAILIAALSKHLNSVCWPQGFDARSVANLSVSRSYHKPLKQTRVIRRQAPSLRLFSMLNTSYLAEKSRHHRLVPRGCPSRFPLRHSLLSKKRAHPSRFQEAKGYGLQSLSLTSTSRLAKQGWDDPLLPQSRLSRSPLWHSLQSEQRTHSSRLRAAKPCLIPLLP